jgi:predicted alpha-1,2-mannosidase
MRALSGPSSVSERALRRWMTMGARGGGQGKATLKRAALIAMGLGLPVLVQAPAVPAVSGGLGANATGIVSARPTSTGSSGAAAGSAESRATRPSRATMQHTAPQTAPTGTASAAATPDSRDLTTYVNPLAGTLGAGFPMVGGYEPFSMIQPGPDTGYAGADDPFTYDGYMYEDPTIHGFSLTHFNGAGIHISGDLPFMPTTGAITSTDHTRYASPYDHAREVATPGYYGVTLDRYQVRAEMTAAARAGLMRFTFPSNPRSNLLLAASESLYGSHPAHVDIGESSLAGWILSRGAPNCAAQHQCYKLYFDAEFDRPFATFGTWNGGTITPGSRTVESAAAGAYVSFDTSVRQVVQVRVGISYVDAAGATSNLDGEVPAGTSFEAVQRSAHDAWNTRLHDIEVTGGFGDQLQTFYTALFRTLSMPSLFDDVDGRYLGFDDLVHTVAAGHHHYSNLSLWDIYRTQTPLLELIEPTVERDVMLSLLDDYDQGHQLIPRWVQANLDYGIMGGDPGTAILADGVMRGLLRGTDATRAYAAMFHQATTLSPPSRANLGAYLRYGYIPEDVSGIGAAVTQEYAIDDDALLQVAKLYGTAQDVATLTPRTGFWRNLMYPGAFAGDPQGHFVRPRNADGSWADPPNDLGLPQPWGPEFQNGYQEGTGWQYLWAEPQDVAGLAAAEGGRDVTVSRLDGFFSSALDGVPDAVPVTQEYSSLFGVYYIGTQYTPANETDLWAAWYYDWLGQPWKTQKVARAEMQVYNSRPDGLPGNDDAGTMTAWYILAALGIYPTTPGMPVFALNSPTFTRAVIHLGSPDASFTIRASQATPLDTYVQSTRLDGASLTRTYLTQCELRASGSLDYRLGPTPNPHWGTGPGAAPPSLSDAQPAPAVQECAASLP